MTLNLTGDARPFGIRLCICPSKDYKQTPRRVVMILECSSFRLPFTRMFLIISREICAYTAFIFLIPTPYKIWNSDAMFLLVFSIANPSTYFLSGAHFEPKLKTRFLVLTSEVNCSQKFLRSRFGSVFWKIWKQCQNSHTYMIL